MKYLVVTLILLTSILHLIHWDLSRELSNNIEERKIDKYKIIKADTNTTSPIKVYYPEEVFEGEPVNITVKVTNTSKVNLVIMYYNINDTGWWFTGPTYILDDIYIFSFPGLRGGTTVEFIIEARGPSGYVYHSHVYSYKVMSKSRNLFPLRLIALNSKLLGILILVIITSSIIYKIFFD